MGRYNDLALWVRRNWDGALNNQATTEPIAQADLQNADLVVVSRALLAAEVGNRAVERDCILALPNGDDPIGYCPGLSARPALAHRRTSIARASALARHTWVWHTERKMKDIKEVTDDAR